MYGDQFDSEKTKLRGKVDDCDFKLFVITIRYVHGVMIVAVVLNERFFFPTLFVGPGYYIEPGSLLPEEDYNSSNSNLTETESSGNEGLEDFWRPFITPSSPVNELVKEDEGSVQPSKNTLGISNGGEEGSDEGSLKTSNSSEKPLKPLKPLKPVKSNKWKPEEMKRLIKLRGQLHARFQVSKGRMALWEEISTSMLADGINRSPGQCKSLWASLVVKFEVCFSVSTLDFKLCTVIRLAA